MGKKFLSIILIAMLMFSVVPTSVFAADSSDFVIEFSSVENVTPGQTFTVDVMIAQNPGVCGFEFPIEYDDALILEKTEVASLDDMTITAKTTIVGESNDMMANSDYTGVIATLTFTASESATTGEYTITTNSMTVYDADLEDLTWDVIPGVITITAPEVVTYDVTVENGTADKATAKEGEKVTITANAAPEGQEFDKWTGNVDFANANAEETTFTMPANDVTVTANYKDKEVTPDPEPEKTYAVTVVGGTASVEKAAVGTAVKVTPTVPEGKKFDSWTAEGIKITESMKYQNPLTFEMPENDVTVTANFVDIDAETYKITVKNGTIVKVDGVEISRTDTVKAEAGAVITIKANDASTGNTFKEWTGNVTFSDKNAKTTTFTMPAEAVTVTATYTSGGSGSGGGSSSGGSSGGGGGAYIPPTVQKTVIVLTIDSTTTTVDGKEVAVDAAPLIVDGRTYTPARFVAEQLGATVAWDEAKQLVTITGKDNTVIELTINSRIAVVNDKAINMDAAAFIKDGRTYTPSRFVAEQLGATVEWDDTTRQVTITKTK